MRWKGATWPTSGSFSIANAYKFICDQQGATDNIDIYERIWKLMVLERIRFFVCLVHRGKILTNMERVRHHLAQDKMCGACVVEDESLLHLFRDCAVAALVPQRLQTWFFAANWEECLHEKLTTM